MVAYFLVEQLHPPEGLRTARALAAFGATALASWYPAATVSAAVGHVVAIEDGFVYQDWLALPLIGEGLAALAAAAVVHVTVSALSKRQHSRS